VDAHVSFAVFQRCRVRIPDLVEALKQAEKDIEAGRVTPVDALCRRPPPHGPVRAMR